MKLKSFGLIFMSTISIYLLPAGITKTFIEPLPLPEEHEPYTTRRLIILLGGNTESPAWLQNLSSSAASRNLIDALETKAAPMVVDATLLGLLQYHVLLQEQAHKPFEEFKEATKEVPLSENVLKLIYTCLQQQSRDFHNMCYTKAFYDLGEENAKSIQWFLDIQARIHKDLFSDWESFSLDKETHFILLIPKASTVAHKDISSIRWIMTDKLKPIPLSQPLKYTIQSKDTYAQEVVQAVRSVKTKYPEISRNLGVYWMGHGNIFGTFSGISIYKIPQLFIALDEIGTRYLWIDSCFVGSEKYAEELQNAITTTHALDESTIVLVGSGEEEAYAKNFPFSIFFERLKKPNAEEDELFRLHKSGFFAPYNSPLVRKPHGFKFSLFKAALRPSVKQQIRGIFGKNITVPTGTQEIEITTNSVEGSITLLGQALPKVRFTSKPLTSKPMPPENKSVPFYRIRELKCTDASLHQVYDMFSAYLLQSNDQPWLEIGQLSTADQPRLNGIVIGRITSPERWNMLFPNETFPTNASEQVIMFYPDTDFDLRAYPNKTLHDSAARTFIDAFSLEPVKAKQIAAEINQVNNIQHEVVGEPFDFPNTIQRIIITTPVISAPILFESSQLPKFFLKIAHKMLFAPSFSFIALKKLDLRMAHLTDLKKAFVDYLDNSSERVAVYIEKVTMEFENMTASDVFIGKRSTLDTLFYVYHFNIKQELSDVDIIYRKEGTQNTWVILSSKEEFTPDPEYQYRPPQVAQQALKNVHEIAQKLGKLDPEKARKRIEAIEATTKQKK